MWDISQALIYTLTPLPFSLCLLGVFLGIVVGAIPGFSGAMLVALTVPITFFMVNVNAMVLLISMYVGSVSGGLISAILLRMPGTPSSIMTTLDGYPMAQAGKATRALGMGITASFVGGLVSWVFLYTLSPSIAMWGAKFGPWEKFTMALMALVLIASLSQGSMIKGLLASFLGILASLPGMDPSTGMMRLTFGVNSMAGGFGLVPVLLGVFVVSQALKDITEIGKPVQRLDAGSSSIFMKLKDWKEQAFNMARSSLIGTWIGVLPGVGGSVGSIVSYTVAKNSSKTPEKFGTGFEDGVIASETANNATIGGALIPLVTLGIPGSTVDAILIGALLLHDLQPGPMLYVTNPEIINTIIASCLIANFVMFAMMIVMVKKIAGLSRIPTSFMMPVILLCCLFGAIAIQNSMFDVWVTLGFGLLGYAMLHFKLPHGPFVIGFILASLAESSLRSGLMASAGSLYPLLNRPLAMVFLIVALLMLVWPMYKERRRKA